MKSGVGKRVILGLSAFLVLAFLGPGCTHTRQPPNLSVNSQNPADNLLAQRPPSLIGINFQDKPADQLLLNVEMYLAMDAADQWPMSAKLLQEPDQFSEEVQCSLRAIALMMLARFSERVDTDAERPPAAPDALDSYIPPPADPSALARSAVEYAEARCESEPGRQVQALTGYANFLSATNQTGEALEWAEKATAKSPPASYERMVTYNALAEIHDDAGEFEERDVARVKAAEAGRAFFRFDLSKPIMQEVMHRFSLSHPAESNIYGVHVLAWAKVLDARLEDLSWSATPDPGELDRLWAEIRYATQMSMGTGMGPGVTWHPSVVVRFARAGHIKGAKALLAELEQDFRGMWSHGKSGDPAKRTEFVEARAAILTAEGKHAEAADAWLAFARRDWDHTQLGASEMSRNDLANVGLAQERVGNLDLAIEFLSTVVTAHETNRSSYHVESRGKFLRGQTIRAYWALLRTYAKRFEQTGSMSDFESALSIARKLTARQFGDVIGADIASSSDISRGGGIPDLKSGELLLKVVWTDNGLVIFSFEPTSSDLSFVSTDTRALADVAARLRNSLRKRHSLGWQADALEISNVALRPAAAGLSRSNRIVIIADGPLSALPLGLLSRPGSNYHALLEDATIRMSPSLAYFSSRRSVSTSTQTQKAFVLANPDYGLPRVASAYSGDRSTRAIEALKLFTPLPETEREVEILAAVFGAGEVTALVRADAAESRIKSLDLNDFRFLHFATHGVLGDQIPGVREPALVLANEPNEDGFLTMGEVQALSLTAELTVLSACDTGSGEYYDGEGVMGLGRAFLMSGSESVLVTYWPIDSFATVEFMKGFYQRLGRGMKKEDALRGTQLEFMHGTDAPSQSQRGVVVSSSKAGTATSDDDQSATRHPFYWAPFVLIGR